MAEFDNIRFINRVDTSTEWYNDKHNLKDGEIVVCHHNDNDLTYLLIGDGNTSPSTIISEGIDSSDNSYSNYFIPCGNPFRAPSGSNLGMVRASSHSGIAISQDGYISSDVAKWDEEKNCYSVDKLYIGTLTVGSQETESTTSSSFITLREGKTSSLSDTEQSGIVFNNVFGEGASAFLGFKKDSSLIFTKDNTDRTLMWATSYFENSTGLISYSSDSGWTITDPKNLTIQTGNSSIKYDGTKEANIDISPYKFYINDIAFTLDTTSREYTITLADQFSQEDRDLLDNVSSRVTNLEDSKFSVSTDSNTLTNTGTSKEMLLSLAEISNGDNPIRSQDVKIENGSQFTCITDLTVDKYGRVTQIQKTTFTLKTT